MKQATEAELSILTKKEKVLYLTAMAHEVTNTQMSMSIENARILQGANDKLLKQRKIEQGKVNRMLYANQVKNIKEQEDKSYLKNFRRK